MNLDLIELLENLFAIGGNHQQNRLIKLKEEFLDYLRDNAMDLFVNPNNHILARDSVLFIDAVNMRATTNDRQKAYSIAKPILDRFAVLKEWNFYEIKLFIGLCSYTSHFQEALAHTIHANLQLAKFKREPRYMHTLAILHYNLMGRLLEAKYFDKLPDDEQKVLKNVFSRFMGESLLLCESKPYFKQVLLLRNALFEQDALAINKACSKLVGLVSDETTLDMILNDVNFYVDSDEYKSLKLKGVQ